MDSVSIAGALVVVGLLAGLVVRYAGRQRGRTRTLRSLDERVSRIERDLRALCAAQANAGDRLVATERELRRIAGGQSRLEMRAPASGSYRQAVTLAAHGAGIDELVENCGLTRAEAELLSRVHGVQGYQEVHNARPSGADMQPNEIRMAQ